MRNFGNPKRGLAPRSFSAALLVGILAVALAGVAIAGNSGPKSRAEAPAPRGSAAASAHAIAGRIRAIAEDDSRLRAKAASAAKKHKGVFSEEIALNAVADGNAIYATSVVLKMTRGRYGSLVNVRLHLDRIDRASGTRTRLLDKLNTYPLGVYARAGGVVLETARILPPPKSKKRSKRAVVARTALYTARHSDPRLSAVDIGEVKIEPRSEEPCGSFPILGGITDAGEPMVAQIDTPCDPRKATPIEKFYTDLRVWKADGSRRDLGRFPVGSMIFNSEFQLSGAKLLFPNPSQPATSVKDVDSGVISNLWSPYAGLRDIASDGTVALVGVPVDNDYYYGVGGIAGKSTESTGTVQPPGAVLPPGYGPGERPPKPKFPFVIFPGGNADDPVVVAPSSESVSGMKFCGDNLFVLDSLTGASERYVDAGYIDDFAIYGDFERGKFEVQLYDLQGHLVRRLLKTGRIEFANLGCNGDKLLLVARRGSGFMATEVAP